jgi:hypothetical protein
MKITKTTVEEVEVAIDSITYRKTNCHAFKVFPDETTICVTNLTGNYAIALNDYADVAFSDSTEECSSEFFVDQYNFVLAIINSQAL